MHPKQITLLLLFLTTFTIQAQNMSNTIGLLTLGDEYKKGNDMIQLLNADGTIWYEFTFYYDDSDGKWDYPNDAFKPMDFHPDYFLLNMACQAMDDEYYTVWVDRGKGITKQVKRDGKLKLQTWEEYILEVFSIDIKETTQILDEPNGKPVKPKFQKKPLSDR